MAELIGQGPTGVPGPTSAFQSSDNKGQVGARARDSKGNEYLYVQFTAAVYFGTLVQITSTHKASPLLGTANIAYRVGVVCGGTPSTNNHPTSTDFGWVQIYGVHPAVQTGLATDAGVSATAGGAYILTPQTSVGTPSGVFMLLAQGTAAATSNVTDDNPYIHNMWVVDLGEVSDLTSFWGSSGASGPTSQLLIDTASFNTGTSAWIGQSMACFLNYPFVNGLSQQTAAGPTS